MRFLPPDLTTLQFPPDLGPGDLLLGDRRIDEGCPCRVFPAYCHRPPEAEP
jgi:hypothetical protein